MRTSAECIRLTAHERGVAVGLDCQEGSPETIASDVLLAVGRVPNTADLGLELAGVETDARGYIMVDDTLATNVPGIWALGDCNGRGAFTHTSWNDYEIVAANLLDGAQRRVSDRIVAYALYIDPPLGRVGKTEAQVRESGVPYSVGMRPMTRVGRAIEKGETLGLMKVIVDPETQSHPGCRDPRHRWRRGDPRRDRHDERAREVSRAAVGGADPPDGVRAIADATQRVAPGSLTESTASQPIETEHFHDIDGALRSTPRLGRPPCERSDLPGRLHRSTTMSPIGCEQHRSRLPSGGISRGSGRYTTAPDTKPLSQL